MCEHFSSGKNMEVFPVRDGAARCIHAYSARASGFIRGHLVLSLQPEENEVTTFDKRERRQGARVVKGDIASFDFSSALRDV
jgi:hypothetical protein